MLFPAVPTPVITGEDLPAARQMAPAVGVGQRPLGPAKWNNVSSHDFYHAVLESDPYPVRGLVGFGSNLLLAFSDPLRGRRALPALIFGSSVFLQVQLVLGLLLGPLAVRAFDQAKGPALAVLAVLVAGTLVFWRIRRRKRAAPAAWMEATCPACIGISLLAERVPSLAELTEPASASTRPDGPKATVS